MGGELFPGELYEGIFAALRGTICDVLLQALQSALVGKKETSVGRLTVFLSDLKNAVRYAFETAVFLLKQDRDDVISTFHYSSIDREGRGYSISPNGFWEINDRFIQGHYKVIYE